MRIPRSWSDGGPVWDGIRAKSRFPGMDGACEPSVLAPSPVVHRFPQVVLLDDAPVPVVGAGAWNVASVRDHRDGASSDAGRKGFLGFLEELLDGVRDALPAADDATTWTQRPWQVDRPIWGIRVVTEQAWQSLGVTVGEPAGAISLAPGEQREVQIFTWHRTRRSLDEESADIVDRQSETSLTTHESYQVAKRFHRELNWGFDAELGIGEGEGSIGTSSSASLIEDVERQYRRSRDATRKLTEHMRSERRVRVSSGEERGIEAREVRKISNPNPCHSVAHQLYEELQHFLVQQAPAEVEYVLAVPNPLPEITAEWVAGHEGVLRDVLRDPSLANGFDAAEELASGTDADVLVAALQRLKAAFRPLPPPQPDDRNGLDILGDALSGFGDVVTTFIDSLTGKKDDEGNGPTIDPLLLLGDPPTTAALEGLMDGALDAPSVRALAAVIVGIVRYHAGRTPGRKLQEAIGYSASVLVGANATESSSAGLQEFVEAEDVAAARAAAGTQLRRARAAFARLKGHIEENLLHYMRAIWQAEDPAQRFARLASFSLGHKPLWSLIENRVLGFHLNATLFPIRLGPELRGQLPLPNDATPPLAEGITGYAAKAPEAAKLMQSRLEDRVAVLRETRTERVAASALQQAVRRARLMVQVDEWRSPDEGATRRSIGPSSILATAAKEAERISATLAFTSLESKVLEQIQGTIVGALDVRVDRGVASQHVRLLSAVVAWAQKQAPIETIVSLPTGGVRVESLPGKCSACSEIAHREHEARIGTAEAERDVRVADAERRRRRLEAGELAADPAASIPLTVEIKKSE